MPQQAHTFHTPARVVARATDPAILRQLIGADLTEIDPYFWSAVISNNRLDFYYGRMAESSLRNYAAEASAGVTFLDSHNNRNLGYGQSLNGVFEVEGEELRTIVDFYTVPGVSFSGILTYASTDDFIRAVQTRLARDVSIGFYGGQSICCICGEDIWEIDWDAWRYLCPHIPGVEYPIGERGEETILCTFDVENAHLAEVSAVYDGATPGATIEKAQRQLESGDLLPGQVHQFERQYRTKLPEPQQRWFIEGKTANTLASRGSELADLLNDLIDGRTTDDAPRSDIIYEMADAADISTETVTEILNANINCPPLEQLEGFARVLDVPVEELIEAAEADGYSYSQESEPMNELDEIRALLAELEPQGETVIEQVRWLIGQNANLSDLADQGRAYRADLIEQALTEGVRANGNDFDRDTYQRILEVAEVATITRMRDDWRQLADAQLGGGPQLNGEGGEGQEYREVDLLNHEVATPDSVYQ